MRKTILFCLWLLVPVVLLAYHYGPGQSRLAMDRAAGKIAEAKASRDVLVHNRGVASKTYESKAGKLARYKDGQRIDIPEYYHRQTWELLRKVVMDISNAAIAKVPWPASAGQRYSI